MRIKEKTQRRTRNVIITFAIICLTPLCEKGRMLNGADSANPFAGSEIICAIELGNDMYSSNGLETGLNYELINRFAKDNHCNVKVVTGNGEKNYLDSLKKGKIDIIITHDMDSVTNDSITELRRLNDCQIWALNSDDSNKSRQLENWIGYMTSSQEYSRISKRFNQSFDPHKRAEKGVITNMVCPYDDLIRKHAASLGWDWRMVAAVIYQESRFAIGSRSFRGAQGLMQVMPQTGLYYGVDNLLDPEQNIIAGTSHLKRLQRMFSKYDLDKEELIKFTLAAYNAGEGRIIDCRNFAASQGVDNTKWDEIVKVIPLMREDFILQEESVKLGKFQGYETIDYITSVMSHYQAICQICPTTSF